MIPTPDDGLDLCCPAMYRITVRGYLDAERTTWFDDLILTTNAETTVLTGAASAAFQGAGAVRLPACSS